MGFLRTLVPRLRRLLAAGALSAAVASSAAAQVVVNEIHYHPASDQDTDEFLELHNTSATPAGVGGWCVDGLDFCFPPGASIAAGGYLVLSPDASRFAAIYGFAPDQVFSGKLLDSGERITLLDPVGQIRDEVVYSDLPPWPVTPDGEGPSIEVIDPAQDNTGPRNWRACRAVAGQTPRARNSADADGLPPWISEVVHPGNPAPSTAMWVTARVQDATTVRLYHKTDFGTESSVPMRDEGTNHDGAAGDGIYGGRIPGRPAGSLVRYRITASGPTGSMSYPRTDDTVVYTGMVVGEPGLTSQLPILHWFMDPADYQQAIDHKLTDETEPAVFAYAGVVYDNVRVRVRGQNARTWPKNHWKVEFPRGHDFFAQGLLTTPVDQFDLQGSYADKSYLREYLGWKTYREAGVPSHEALHVRVQQNGDFYGLYLLLEDADAEWLARNGLDQDGSNYQAFEDLHDPGSAQALEPDYDKKSRLDEDYSDLYALVSGINGLSGTARRNFLYDNLALPGILNYIAATTILHNNDHVRKNYYVYRDTEGTGRWTLHPWDLDLTFGRNWNGASLNDEIWADVDVVPDQVNVSPSHPLFGDNSHRKYGKEYNRLINRLHADADIRKMYFRRLRTLMDTLLVEGRYEGTIDEIVPRIAPEAELDRARWGQYGEGQTLDEAVAILKQEYLGPRRTHLFVTHQNASEIPPAQTAAPRIVLSEISYDPPEGDDREFVELYNPSASEAVDLTGFRLQGVGLRIPAGTVLLPGKRVVFVKSDVGFRAGYGSGKFVAAEYPGSLDDGGETLVLRDGQGREVSSVSYGTAAPWPILPGRSLELIDATRETRWIANWSASAAAGGTPGAPNGSAGTLPAFPGVWINEVLPGNRWSLADEQGDFDPWIELYNPSSSAVSLAGFFLTDDLGSPAKWPIPAGTNLCAGCFLLLWADGEPGEGARHTSFRLDATGGFVALYDAGGRILDHVAYGDLASDVSLGRFPDGAVSLRDLEQPTPGAVNHALSVPLALNEYNAVDSAGFLDNPAGDAHWGRIPGNGGDWFELVVTQDRVDVRGWQLEIRDDPGGPDEQVEVLTLSQDPLWSDLRSGTILTVSEDLPDDVSFDRGNGDWWINVQAADGASGAFVTPESFPVSNHDWQLTIRDATGIAVFGPVGEGIVPASGVGSDEVFKLEEDPSPWLTPSSNYNDGTSSTFGAPNRYSGGTIAQDFDAIRCGGQDCSALDGACGLGICDGSTGACRVVSDLPPEVSGLAVDGKTPTDLSWGGLPGNVRYDVASGLLSELREDGGVRRADCLRDDAATPSAEDDRPQPGPGEGRYYVVRAQDACGSGVYGRDSGGQERVPEDGCP